MEPTHPDRLVENVTAPSAGGSPDPDGKAATFSDNPSLATEHFRYGCSEVVGPEAGLRWGLSIGGRSWPGEDRRGGRRW